MIALIALSFNAFASTVSPFNDRMESLNSIVISSNSIQQHIKTGDFDKVFTLYNNIKDEKINIEHFSTSIDTTTVVNNLTEDQNNILDFSYDTIKNNTDKIIPSNNHPEGPEGIIVLGATPKLGILESRLDQAYNLAIKYKKIPLILSGKGLKEGVVEADYMYDYLINKGINASRLYKESESLDTVGNAEFSYFTIIRNDSLSSIKDWLIITNNYHAMRSLFNFSHIFPDDYNLSVLLSPLLPDGVDNPEEDKILRKLVSDEIKSDTNRQFMKLLSYDQYDTLDDTFTKKNITGKPCGILTEILLNHNLYKDQSDKFIAKFSQCYKNARSQQ